MIFYVICPVIMVAINWIGVEVSFFMDDWTTFASSNGVADIWVHSTMVGSRVLQAS
jgi:hypothetical protein